MPPLQLPPFGSLYLSLPVVDGLALAFQPVFIDIHQQNTPRLAARSHPGHRALSGGTARAGC